MRRILKGLALAAAATVFSSSAALAGFTNVGLVPAKEHSQEKIFETIYGGDFHRTGTDFFNGTITIRRVDDGMTSTPPMSMARGTVGDTTDETWAGSMFTVKALAKFSANTQKLMIGDSSGAVTPLFNASGYGYNVSGSASFDATDKTTHFMRVGDTGTHYSITGMNDDGRDHMLTYEVLGLAGVKDKVWVMFWEDLSRVNGLSAKRTHSDYNDLVVEMRATAVPLPAAAWGAIALGGVAAAFRRRLRRIAGA